MIRDALEFRQIFQEPDFPVFSRQREYFQICALGQWGKVAQLLAAIQPQFPNGQASQRLEVRDRRAIQVQCLQRHFCQW